MKVWSTFLFIGCFSIITALYGQTGSYELLQGNEIFNLLEYDGSKNDLVRESIMRRQKTGVKAYVSENFSSLETAREDSSYLIFEFTNYLLQGEDKKKYHKSDTITVMPANRLLQIKTPLTLNHEYYLRQILAYGGFTIDDCKSLDNSYVSICSNEVYHLISNSATGLIIISKIKDKLKEHQTKSIEEDFRSELDSHNMIVKSGVGVVEAIWMVAHSQLKFLRICGYKGVRNTPDYCDRNYVNTFAVDFSGIKNFDFLSSQNKKLAFALENNCLTVGSSVFCDRDFLLRLRMLAKANYKKLHLTRNPVSIEYLTEKKGIARATWDSVMRKQYFLPNLNADLAGILNFQVAERKDESHQDNQFISETIFYDKKYSSIFSELAENTNVYLPIAHEVAHLWQNKPPFENDNLDYYLAFIREDYPYSWNKWGEKIKKSEFKKIALDYLSLTCQTITPEELFADIYSVYIILQIMESTKSLSSLLYLSEFDPNSVSKDQLHEMIQISNIYSTFNAERKIIIPNITDIDASFKWRESLDSASLDKWKESAEHLNKLHLAKNTEVHGEENMKLFTDVNIGIGLYTFLRSMEYELIYAKDIEHAKKIILNEPHNLLDESNAMDFFRYHYEFEKERLLKVGYFSSSHMDDSYRLLLMLKQFEMIDHLYKLDPMILIGSYRLFGYIAGRLTAIQMLKCGKSEFEAYNHSMDVLSEFLPVK